MCLALLCCAPQQREINAPQYRLQLYVTQALNSRRPRQIRHHRHLHPCRRGQITLEAGLAAPCSAAEQVLGILHQQCWERQYLGTVLHALRSCKRPAPLGPTPLESGQQQALLDGQCLITVPIGKSLPLLETAQKTLISVSKRGMRSMVAACIQTQPGSSE